MDSKMSKKEELLRLVKADYVSVHICKNLNIGRSTFYKWIKQIEETVKAYNGRVRKEKNGKAVLFKIIIDDNDFTRLIDYLHSTTTPTTKGSVHDQIDDKTNRADKNTTELIPAKNHRDTDVSFYEDFEKTRKETYRLGYGVRSFVMNTILKSDYLHEWIGLPKLNELERNILEKSHVSVHQLKIMIRDEAIDFFKYSKKLDNMGFKIKSDFNSMCLAGFYEHYYFEIFKDVIEAQGEKGESSVNPFLLFDILRQLYLEVTGTELKAKFEIIIFEARADVDKYDDFKIKELLFGILNEYGGRIDGPFGKKMTIYYHVPVSQKTILFKYYVDSGHRILESISSSGHNTFPEDASMALAFVIKKLEDQLLEKQVKLPLVVSEDEIKNYIKNLLQLDDEEMEFLVAIYDLYVHRLPTHFITVAERAGITKERGAVIMDSLIKKGLITDKGGGNLWLNDSVKHTILGLMYQLR